LVPAPLTVSAAGEADEVSWYGGIRLGKPLPRLMRQTVLAADPGFAKAAIIWMQGGGNPFWSPTPSGMP
jgi:hypothetical protein